MTRPYYVDDDVTLYCGDMAVVLLDIASTFDCVVTDRNLHGVGPVARRMA